MNWMINMRTLDRDSTVFNFLKTFHLLLLLIIFFFYQKSSGEILTTFEFSDHDEQLQRKSFVRALATIVEKNCLGRRRVCRKTRECGPHIRTNAENEFPAENAFSWSS